MLPAAVCLADRRPPGRQAGGVDLLCRLPGVTGWRVMPGNPPRDTLVMYSGVSGLGGEMARSRQGAGDPPVAITAQGGSGQAPRPGTAGRGSKVVWGLVALGVVRQTLRSRRFQEGVGVAVIALGALRGIGQDNRASTMARLSAWDKRQIQRLQLQAERQALRIEHKAERHARTVRGARQMARSGPPRGLAAANDAEADGGRTA